MVRVWVLQRVHSGDGCDLASTLCMYDLRKGVLRWERVRRVRRGSISSELLMCCVVVVRLPRPMEGNGVTPIFRSLHNC